jgi:hypothetical protein
MWRLGSSVDTAKGLDGGRKMCGLDLYSLETLQTRKERFGREDSVGGAMERNLTPVWRRRRP